ncbi:MAG TPA: ABC transporter ATP-binding protein [Gaiellaceae bacterium]|jgi:multiple sugar transport system ATP-binding protein|nr:ABC transporter ATP-binding protein [Gaiellaceae bacterium]
MAQIAFEGVTKRFEDGTVAVDDVTMEIGDGEFMVLVGPSGSGKTTMMRMVAGLEVASDGTIRIGGEVVNDLPVRSRNVAMVFQNYALYPHMSVAGNMGFPLRLAKMPKAEIEERVRHAAEMLGLSELLDRKPRQLSGGQRQRVAMGRAIVRNPSAFLMDEPLSNLDAKLRVEMRSYIARLHQELKTTTLYVTHDQSEAMTMGDRVALMRDGRIVQLDTPSVLYERPADLFVAGFIGSPAMNVIRGRLQDGGDGAVEVDAGSLRFPVPPEALAERPALAGYRGRDVLVGVRPEAFADAGFEASHDGRHLFQARVSLAQSMGSEMIVHFDPAGGTVDSTGATAFSADGADLGSTNQLAHDGKLVGRFDPRTKAAAGAELTVSLDLARIHFFDPETDRAIH